MMYKIIYTISLILFIFFFSYYFTSKKEITLVLNGKSINARLANVLSSEMIISTQNNKKYIKMLDTLVDHPMLFVPSKNSNSIFVLYFFDIEMHVFSIKINIDTLDVNKTNLNNSLNRIILATHGFGIESLSKIKIDEMINKISMMSKRDYKRLSVPSLDLGLYKIYIPKKRVIEMLRKGVSKLDDMNSSRIQSKLNNVW